MVPGVRRRRAPSDYLCSNRHPPGLFERDGAIVLRGYASEAQDGWFNVEVVNRISWRTIPNLRKQAAHLAARWGVPFEDKLVGDR